MKLCLITMLAGMSIVILAGDIRMSSSECNNVTHIWVRSGNLYHHSSHPCDPDLSYYRYVNEEKSIEICTNDGSIGNISEILKAESINELDEAILFNIIRNFILPASMSNEHILNQNFFDGWVNDFIYGPRSDKEKEILSSLLKAEDFKIEIKPSEQKWQATFIVVTFDGSVERWLLAGSLNPMDINQIDRKMLYPNGTISRMATF